MSHVRKAGAVISTAVMVVALSALTRVPWRTGDGDAALLRLSWRARGEIVESCRRSTREELARMPAHMRQEVVCEDPRVAPYALEVRVDGLLVVDGAVAGSGARGEGTLYVLHERALDAGAHRVQVRFARQADPRATPEPDRERTEDATGSPRSRRRHTVPPLLALDTTITLPRGRVALVTYAPEEERLVVLGDEPAIPARQP